MGQQGDYGQYGQGQDPRRRPAATPPQWQQQAPPQRDGTGQLRYPYRQDSQPAFTPGYQGQPQPPRGQYPPPQPAWQQPYEQQPQYPPQPQYAPQPPPRQRKRHTGRKVLGAVAGLAAAIIVIAVAANSGHSVQTTGSSPGGGTRTAATGTAITLSGNSSGEKMSVTVTKVISDAQGDDFTSAPAGDRLYAVQFRLADTGSAAYSDSPSNGATVTDSSGQSYQAAIADTVAGCTSFPAIENIAPGSSGLGCIVFEVPQAAKITQVQFTLDSGMGPQTGQWNVG
jgi:hypothetical protein